MTARRFLTSKLPDGGLRAATVEDVCDALAGMSAGLSEASARQYVLRIKSLSVTPCARLHAIQCRGDHQSQVGRVAVMPTWPS